MIQKIHSALKITEIWNSQSLGPKGLDIKVIDNTKVTYVDIDFNTIEIEFIDNVILFENNQYSSFEEFLNEFCGGVTEDVEDILSKLT